MCKQNAEKVFPVSDIYIWRCCNKLSPLRRDYLPLATNVLRRFCISLTQIFSNWFVFIVINNNGKGDVVEFSTVFWPVYQERLFPTQLPSQWSINMVKVLSFRFQKCFGLFTMLIVEGFSQTGLFRHLPNHVFRSP